ncbi:MAG: GtrA family protein [Clostridia bacterium]|nr:GtrA family protein [Clostridia bacterium]
MNIIVKLVSKEVFSYLLFGVLTTVVNMIVFKIFKDRMDVLIANIIAWVAAVIFAFVTNKLFVFESKSWAPKVLAKEIPSFTGARVLTLGIEELGLFVMINLLHLEKVLTIPSLVSGEMVIKLIIAVVVVILNYIFSKLIIFRKKDFSKEG